MQYLANNNYTHGNLKARNCLLDDSLNVKVADFCPVQDSKETGYLVSSMARWLAPEVFTNHKFSLQSDVWSYAVVCWEVFNLGRVPYYGMEIVDLPHLLKKGLRLEQPMLSPQIMYMHFLACIRVCLSMVIPLLPSLTSLSPSHLPPSHLSLPPSF
jgi:abelson tyrosine-protein kinase 1